MRYILILEVYLERVDRNINNIKRMYLKREDRYRFLFSIYSILVDVYLILLDVYPRIY